MLSQINLPPTAIKREMELIFNPVKFGDSGIVICYPSCQQDFNVARFLTYKKELKKILGQHHNRFAFLMLHVDAEDTKESFIEKFRFEGKKYSKQITDEENPKAICQKILNNGLDPYLFLFNAQSLKSSTLTSTILLIQDAILSVNKFGAQIFIESNIFKQEFIKILSGNNKLLRNVEYVPTYSLEETRWYIKSLAREWKMKLSEKKITEIITLCFGYLWILREVLRLIKVTKNENIAEVFSSPSIKIRIETILNMLTKEEKLATIDLLNQKISKQYEAEKTYLFQTGVVIKQINKFVLPLKPMEKLLAKTKILSNFLVDEQNNIIFEEKNISSQFSIGELRIIRLLLTKKGQLVTRDEIAQTIWKIHWEEKYSDWAIDKVISRLRTVLSRLNLPKNIITTLKGRGIILN